MSKFDRYKKKHRNDPKPEKKMLPHSGDIVESKQNGLGIMFDVTSKSAKVMYLNGVIRMLEN